MTGSSLHTKYRPEVLDEVVGQAHVKKPLAVALELGEQQAFLFEGPSGTGKTTLARICARQLGCELIEIDARPSDAIAVAVTCDRTLPIYVNEDVLNDVLGE